MFYVYKIARKYGVAPRTPRTTRIIRDIKNRVSWKHVK